MFDRRHFGLVLLSMGLGTAVLAQPRDRWPDNRGGGSRFSISDRVGMAERRIEQGRRSGQLTREEAQRLMAEFRDVRRQEERARRDGRLDMRERERLDRELDRLERHISRLKNNEEVRGDRGDRGDRGGRRN